MRSALIAIAAVCVFAAPGCDRYNLTKNGCSSCGQGGHGGHAHHGGLGGGHARHGGGGGLFSGGRGGHGDGGGIGSGLAAALGSHSGGMEPSPVARLGQEYHMPPNPGPQTATYGYPYYTVRAPRDFLMDNPPSIGY